MSEKRFERYEDDTYYNVIKDNVTGKIYSDADEIAEILNYMFQETEIEGIPKECVEHNPKLRYFISDEAPLMFRVLHNLCDNDEGTLFIAFEMGSIRLDISNPNNWIEVNRTYMLVYNDINHETSVLRTDKITGFIYEPPTEEVDLESLEKELREELDIE